MITGLKCDLASEEYSISLSGVAFAVCLGSLSICTVRRRPSSFVAYGWMWAESVDLHTSEIILILLSADTSIKTSDTVQFAAKRAHDKTLPHPCLTHDVDHELFLLSLSITLV